jgi:hypothetical protein
MTMKMSPPHFYLASKLSDFYVARKEMIQAETNVKLAQNYQDYIKALRRLEERFNGVQNVHGASSAESRSKKEHGADCTSAT